MKESHKIIVSTRLMMFVVFCTIMLIVITSVNLSVLDTTPPPVPKPGSQIDLRGYSILLLRNVVEKPYFGLGVDYNEYASLFSYPKRPGTVKKLTAQEWESITLLRTQWCNGELMLQASEMEQQALDFGVRCSDTSFAVKQGKIALTNIPPVLLEIIQRLQSSSQ